MESEGGSSFSPPFRRPAALRSVASAPNNAGITLFIQTMSNPDNGDIFLGTGNLDISSRPNEVKLSTVLGEPSFYEQRIPPPTSKNPKRAVDLHVYPRPIPFPESLTHRRRDLA